jgi:hypothetical protein
LFLSDLDGTLLRSDATLGEATIEIVTQLLGQGLLFSYATARSHLRASAVTARLPLTLPVAVYGGAVLADVRSGAPLSINSLEPAATDLLIEQCRAAGIPPLLHCQFGGRDRVVWVRGEESDGVHDYLAARVDDPRLAPVASWAELPRADVFYVAVIGAAEPVSALAATVSGAHVTLQTDTYPPHHTWLELSAFGTNKASAAVRLKEIAGADRLVVFGDNVNDLPMFEVADECYAVANATAVLRDRATEVIESNDEDGVARMVAKLSAR